MAEATSDPDPRPDRTPDRDARGRRRAIVLLAAVLVVPCLALFAWRPSGFHATDITGATWGRHFRMPDQDGRIRTLADFRGDVLLMFFGFVQCPDVCPTTMARAADVVARLGKDGRRVQVIFVTLDPERDTATILKSYVRAFDPRFIALRDDAASLEGMAREFHIFYRRVPTGSSYTLDHTALTYAFDPEGRLRLAIGHEQTAADVASDVEKLL